MLRSEYSSEKLTEELTKEESISEEGQVCRLCEKHSEKLYQDDTCKDCLVKSFRRLIPFIDHHRNPK